MSGISLQFLPISQKRLLRISLNTEVFKELISVSILMSLTEKTMKNTVLLQHRALSLQKYLTTGLLMRPDLKTGM